MREGVKQSVLSVCQSVSQSVSQSVCSEIRIFTSLVPRLGLGTRLNIYYVKGLLYAAVTWQSKKNVCVPDRDQSSLLLCISNSFIFNIGIVRHFDMVNLLDIRWRPVSVRSPTYRKSIRIHSNLLAHYSGKFYGNNRFL